MKKIAITLIMLATSISASAGEVGMKVDPFTDKVASVIWESNISDNDGQFFIWAGDYEMLRFADRDTCTSKRVNVDIRIDKNEAMKLNLYCEVSNGVRLLTLRKLTPSDVKKYNSKNGRDANLEILWLLGNIQLEITMNDMRKGTTMIVRVEDSNTIHKFNLKGVDKMFRTVKKVFHRTLGENNL